VDFPFEIRMVATERVTLGLFVEGHGEEHGAPSLIRRIARASSFHGTIRCETRRIPKSKFVQPGELERAVEALSRKIGRGNPMLILLDADDDCPRSLADDLKARCRVGHPDLLISIVIAKKEYESWFLAAARSLSGKRGLAERVDPPDDPESIRGAKEWLTTHMPSDQSYSPTRHQAAYSELMDLSEARRERSFRKFEKEVGSLLGLK
jgi:Domain of unknown function (DUF4276)